METTLFFIIGLCFGSFLNVLILRTPKGEEFIKKSSHCYTCGTPLKWYHNIPLLSWLVLRGKCGFCKTKISIQYPLVELICGFIFLAMYYKSDFDIINASILSLVFSLLLGLSIIDLRYKAVPDVLSIPTLLIAIFYADFLTSLQGALILGGAVAFLRILISAVIKREAMGEADIIIAGVMGAILGVKFGLISIYIGAIFALIAFVILRKRDFELPFIPFLSLGLFVTFLFQDTIGKFYE